MIETALGGLIALAATMLAQRWQGRRDDARWTKESSRRFYGERRDAYMAFLTKLSSYAKSAEDWKWRGDQPPSNLEWDVMDPVYELLTPIRAYGTPDGYRLGNEAAKELWKLMQDDGKNPGQLRAAKAKFIQQMRIDLDIDDNGLDEAK